MNTPAAVRMKNAILAENIGFRMWGSGYSYHLWLTDTEKRILTPPERRVLVRWLNEGRVRRVHALGSTFRGYVTWSGS